MSFQDALNVKVESIERPPAPPQGHYRMKITGYKYGDISSDKGAWDTIDFQCQAIEANDDVDPQDLAAFGGPNMVKLRRSFMFDKGTDEEAVAKAKRTLFGVKQFLVEHCGLSETGSLREIIDSSKGAEFLASVKHRKDKNDPEVVYGEIDRTAPL